MVPVLIVKHRREQVFLVRFLSDNKEMDDVDLSRIRFRLKEESHGPGQEFTTGSANTAKNARKKRDNASAGAGKSGTCEKREGSERSEGEPEKKKKRVSKGKMWDELVEQDDKKDKPHVSREERKALAVWQRFLTSESPVRDPMHTYPGALYVAMLISGCIVYDFSSKRFKLACLSFRKLDVKIFRECKVADVDERLADAVLVF